MTSVRHAPGQNASHGATSMNWRPSWLSRPPQVGISRGSPNPRKLIEASLIITPPIVMLNPMMMMGTMLGTTCLRNVLHLSVPIASAARM